MVNQFDDNYVIIDNLTKKYQQKTIIKNLSLTINNHERIAIVGPNGCGKTTLCEIIAQIRKPTDGSVTLKENLRIGMQLQESKYPKGISGWDLASYYLSSYRSKKSVESIQKLLYYLDVEDIFSLPIAKLSGGQQQKINLLLSLIVDPNLLILDELGTGLDIEVRERIYELLTTTILPQKDLALIMVTHNMEEVERFCNQVLFMLDGKIISISDVAKIKGEYGSVEQFVKEQFQEYKIGMYNTTKLANRLSVNENKTWVKKWQKQLAKNKKLKD